MMLRSLLGLLAGAMLLLSSAAHGYLGWLGIRTRLLEEGASPTLVSGLRIAWQFGTAAMLAFAGIVLLLTVRRLRGETVSPLPLLVIGATYLVYGAWAIWASHGELFFSFMFLLPGVLLLASGLPERRPG